MEFSTAVEENKTSSNELKVMPNRIVKFKDELTVITIWAMCINIYIYIYIYIFFAQYFDQIREISEMCINLLI